VGTDRGDKNSDQFAWSVKVIALTEVGLLKQYGLENAA
jgi:hypothetical protein